MNCAFTSATLVIDPVEEGPIHEKLFELLAQVFASGVLEHLVGAFALADAAFGQLECGVVDLLPRAILATREVREKLIQGAVRLVVIADQHVIHDFVQKSCLDLFKFFLGLLLSHAI